jgi:tRNA(fMet)-specific endonuclease VapC
LSFLLDTDICSAHLKGRASLEGRFIQYGSRFHISAVSVGELKTWALRAAAPASRRQAIEDLLQSLAVLPIDEQVADIYAAIRAGQLDTGAQTPRLDLLIAATALVHGLTLVTHNVKDFASIAGLSVVDWLTP